MQPLHWEIIFSGSFTNYEFLRAPEKPRYLSCQNEFLALYVMSRIKYIGSPTAWSTTVRFVKNYRVGKTDTHYNNWWSCTADEPSHHFNMFSWREGVIDKDLFSCLLPVVVSSRLERSSVSVTATTKSYRELVASGCLSRISKTLNNEQCIAQQAFTTESSLSSLISALLIFNFYQWNAPEKVEITDFWLLIF